MNPVEEISEALSGPTGDEREKNGCNRGHQIQEHRQPHVPLGFRIDGTDAQNERQAEPNQEPPSYCCQFHSAPPFYIIPYLQNFANSIALQRFYCYNITSWRDDICLNRLRAGWQNSMTAPCFRYQSWRAVSSACRKVSRETRLHSWATH